MISSLSFFSFRFLLIRELCISFVTPYSTAAPGKMLHIASELDFRQPVERIKAAWKTISFYAGKVGRAVELCFFVPRLLAVFFMQKNQRQKPKAGGPHFRGKTGMLESLLHLMKAGVLAVGECFR